MCITQCFTICLCVGKNRVTDEAGIAAVKVCVSEARKLAQSFTKDKRWVDLIEGQGLIRCYIYVCTLCVIFKTTNKISPFSRAHSTYNIMLHVSLVVCMSIVIMVDCSRLVTTRFANTSYQHSLRFLTVVLAINAAFFYGVVNLHCSIVFGSLAPITLCGSVCVWYTLHSAVWLIGPPCILYTCSNKSNNYLYERHYC